MGQQIIRQPDGRYAIFGSSSGRILVWDASEAEVIDYFADAAAQLARTNAARQLGHVAGGRPQEAYYQFVVTWEEALAEDRKNGGTTWDLFPAAPQRE